MLCVTGNEDTIDALARRIARAEAHPRREVLLQEVRIDALGDGALEPLFALLARTPARVIVCNRPVRQGGAFDGPEADRIRLLARAGACGVAYVDLEADCGAAALDAVRAAIAESARDGRRGQLMLSSHDFAGVPADLDVQVDRMAARQPDLIKVAVAVDDAIQLDALRGQHRRAGRPVLAIGMGLAGLVSRARYPAFGAPWTYVKADEQSGTAPGQLSLAQALEMGLPESATAPFLALVGGPQVQYSKGPLVYNRLFRRRGRPWSYLPVSTAAGEETLHMLRALGLLGASVTMPHKGVALALAGDGADDLARLAGAANSLRCEGDTFAATNSDVAGVAEPLLRALAALDGDRPRRALVLGGGGAARAAVLAARQLELEVAVSAIEDIRAIFAPEVRCVAWDERSAVPAEILINATPVAGSKVMPWPADVPLDKRVVFDLAISGEPSLLLARAAEAGAVTIEPIEMWLAQGAAQMSWVLREPCTVEELRELLT